MKKTVEIKGFWDGDTSFWRVYVDGKMHTAHYTYEEAEEEADRIRAEQEDKTMNRTEKAIARLIENWKKIVANGEMDKDELEQSLTEQAEMNCQGWDSSEVELENDPELAEIMGYNTEDMTDEQYDEWTQIVTEAAKKYLKEDTGMTDSKALTFEINRVIYSTKDRTGNYFYKTINGQKVRIKEAEFTKALVQAMALETPAELTDNGLVDCRNCPMKDTCIHHDAMRRNPVKVGGLALCPRLGVDTWEAEADAEKKAREDKIEADAKEAEEAVAKKTKKRAKKNVAFRYTEGDTEVTLTEKQVKFIKLLPSDDFYENGLDSSLWIDVLCDTFAESFNPMALGAMVSTLREKDLISVGVQRVNGRKCKSFTFTELGKKVAKELGLE